jgi:predicted glycosyltransferase
MSDQTARADIMRRIGFHVLTGKELSVENLADLIQQSLIQPAIRSSIDLGGAGKSAEFIARLTNIGVAKQNG